MAGAAFFAAVSFCAGAARLAAAIFFAGAAFRPVGADRSAGFALVERAGAGLRGDPDLAAVAAGFTTALPDAALVGAAFVGAAFVGAVLVGAVLVAAALLGAVLVRAAFVGAAFFAAAAFLPGAATLPARAEVFLTAAAAC